jgi:capsular exopolysaccharide synthesis family protein
MRQYNELQRRLDIATKTLSQLLIQRETLRVDAAQKEVPWEMVSAPEIPHDAKGNMLPARSGNPKKLAMGVIAAIVLGLGAAALKEKYYDLFYTTEDIQDRLELPLLGVIPLNKSAKHPNSSGVVKSIEGTQANHNEASLFLEAFDSLYASIHFLASNPPVRSLVVSSASPGDGKTTTALHLGQAAALMGQRVLLVDANLRLPQIHTSLGLLNVQGLSNLLSQNLDPNALIQQSPMEENLFVLTSGQIRSHSTRLLASNRMQDLMEQFQAAFDLVIYDAPHLLGVADANFLAEHTDGLLMVVGVGKTKRSVVMQVLDGLNSFRLPILGIVANHVKASKNSSYGYNNRYYEQNHRVHPKEAKTAKVFTTDLLTSVKASDDALR